MKVIFTKQFVIKSTIFCCFDVFSVQLPPMIHVKTKIPKIRPVFSSFRFFCLWYNTLGIRVASRVAKWLKTYEDRQLVKIKRISNHSLLPSLLSRIFFSILKIYKDSQFNNTKIKNSKIQVQNKTQTLRKSYTFLSKACTRGEHLNINKQVNK